MIIGVIGLLILIVSTLLWRDINLILFGIGIITFDVIAELALLNSNLKVLIQNNNVWFSRITEAIKETKK